MTKLIKLRKTGSRYLLQFFLVALVCDALVDQSDMFFRLKMPLFVSVFLVWAYRQANMNPRMKSERVRRLSLPIWINTMTIALAIPSVWTLIGTLCNDAHAGEAPLGLLKTFLFFAIVPVLLSENIDLMIIIIRAGVLVAVITIAMLVLDLISFQLFLGLFKFLADNKNAVVIQERSFSGISIGEFYYASCPIMIFPFTYHCARLFEHPCRKLVSCTMFTLFVLAIIASGARADILAALGVTTVFGVRRILRSWGFLPAILFGALILGSAALIIIPRFGDAKETSNAIKLKHMDSYIEEFASNPRALIIGEGANQEFYSNGFKRYTIDTELTYLEFIRIFGLPMTILFGLGALWAIHRIFKGGDFHLGIAYLAYFLIALSNPLILNSTGFMVLASMYCYVARGEAKRTQIQIIGAQLASH